MYYYGGVVINAKRSIMRPTIFQVICIACICILLIATDYGMTDIQNTANFSQILIIILIFWNSSLKILNKCNRNYSDISTNIKCLNRRSNIRIYHRIPIIK